MKNNSTKILVAVLSMVLLIGAAFAMTVNATTENKPEISSQNVKYTDKFCLMYAIPADTVKGGQVTLNVYDTIPSESIDPIKSYTVKYTTPAGKGEGKSGLDYEAYIITTDGVGAMDLDKVFYVQAIDGEENASDVKSYSVVEYLYTRLADVDGEANTEKQNNLYKSVIYFGTCAQQQFLKEDVLEDTTLISDYCYVTTDGCTINGKTAAVVPQNKAFTVIGNDGALSGCTVTTYDTYTTAGTATVTEVTGNAVTIEKSCRAQIVAGSSKVYKAGTEGFEGYNIGDKPFGIAASNDIKFEGSNASLRINAWNWRNDGAITIASDKVYGVDSKVFKFKYTENGNLSVAPTQGTTVREEATEVELSFDFKFDDTNTNTGNVFRINFYETHNNNAVIGLYVGVSDNGKLYFKDTRGDAKTFETDFDAYQWNSIKLVFTDGTSNDGTYTYPLLKLYVNNDSETSDTIVKFNNSNTKFSMVEKIKEFDLRHMNVSAATDSQAIYFDNLWCGFNK